MWHLLICVAALVTAVQGTCDSDTLYFGDLNPATTSPYQLQVISALGTYVLEPNNVSLVAYRHIGRPDQFLLREPTAAAVKRWVVATLPDDKKPERVQHAYEAWPESGNILATGEFEDEPWSAGAGAWLVRDCDEGRSPLATLNVSCVPKHFGQCSTDRWRVTGPAGGDSFDVLTPSSTYVNGRRQYTSLTEKLSVGADGRWRLTSVLPGQGSLVSSTPAERLEFVRGWRAVDAAGQETDAPGRSVQCEPIPAPGGEGGDPCATNPCKNGGTCLPAPDDPAAYLCRCRFDSVSLNCMEVRECKPPPTVANGHLLFTSDLSPHGKAFYRCDVGYFIKNADTKADKKANAFATCDGARWQNVPTCVPITTQVTIAAAYVHSCDFDAGWCDYRHAPTLTLSGRSSGWERVSAAGRGYAAEVRGSGDGRRQGGAPGDPLHTKSRTDWTTATLTLPPGGNRLTFEAITEGGGTSVGVDNVRVFQWNCKQVGKLLFSSASSGSVQEKLLPLLSLLLLLVYSGFAGVLEA
ncbi:uncharacterized protein LOC119113554 [Pollicipes pollicipes]|uniref:uncharacterized protein LOC119113554 n=1 Tax=Pollicipes pollicipes TaxID=41117 RepID=UPI00188539F7|nr:uncharacterized protein LOC119113554 [Pollicipes pollicipes]